MSDRIVIFANPIAGRGQGRVVADRLGAALRQTGFTVETFLVQPADVPATALAKPAAAAIAIGGDGTLRAAAELFITADYEVPPFIPIPMGTANLMGKHLGLSWSARGMPRAVIEMIRQKKIVRLDAGLANGRLFLLMVGVGIDAQVVHVLDRFRRGPIDLTSYVLPAALTFAGYRFPPITVTVDEKVLLKSTPAILLIGNVKEYGIGFPILTEARPDDGLLDVCIMPCRNRLELIEILVQIAAGEHALRETVIYTRGKTMRVDTSKSLAVQIDGDSSGFTPVDVQVLPGRVPFLLPASPM